MTTTRYDSYSGSSGSSGDDERARQLKTTNFTEIEFEPAAALGSESEFGQSLATIFGDVRILDGALYIDVDKGNLKLFSWKTVTGFHPEEWYHDRDDPITVDDADEIMSKDYNVAQVTYEFVGGRVPPVTDEGGEVVHDATSKTKEITGSEENFELSDGFEDLGGDPVPVGDTITFWGAGENGPAVKSRRAAELFTQYGDDVVVDEDDAFNWLTDTTGDNVLRGDFGERRVRMLVVERESENGYNYSTVVLEDAETGTELGPQNRNTAPTSSSSDDDGSALEKAKRQDAGAYPDPIAEFISSGRNLNLTVERAENLLNELVEDETNGLTEDMVSDHGGREELIEQVV